MLLSSGATSTSMYVTGTMLTVVVQGEKEVFLGRQVQRYGPRQYMVLPVDLPLQAREKAPNDKLPLLGLCLPLDRPLRSEERRVGNECVSTCSFRGLVYY